MMTPIKAIRAKCLDCCCGSYTEVKLCPARDCPIWPYRSGHRPTSKHSFDNEIEEVAEEE